MQYHRCDLNSYRESSELRQDQDSKTLNKSSSGTTLSAKAEIKGLSESDIEIGEDELRNEHDFKIMNFFNETYNEGRFIITRLKCVFVPYEQEVANDPFLKRYFTVELNMIEKLTKYASKKHPDQFYLDIFTKDFRQLRITPRSTPNMDEIYNNLLMVAFPSKYSSSIIALKYEMTLSKMDYYDQLVIEKLMHVIPEYRNYTKLPKDGWKVYLKRIIIFIGLSI